MTPDIIIYAGKRFFLYYDRLLRFQWLPSLYRFQDRAWHLYWWKFRLTRASRKCREREGFFANSAKRDARRAK